MWLKTGSPELEVQRKKNPNLIYNLLHHSPGADFGDYAVKMYVYTVQCPESLRTPVVNQNSFYAKVDFSPDVLLGFSCLEIFEKLEDIFVFFPIPGLMKCYLNIVIIL